jgi:dipeptidyl-peptidase-4
MRRLLLALAVLTGPGALAQQKPSAPPAAMNTSQDNAFLREFAETRRYMSGRPVGARATPDEKTVLFLRGQATSPVQTLFAFDVASGQAKELLNPDTLLKGAQAELSVEEKARLERMRISARGFTAYGLSEDGERILVTLSGKLYVVERASGKVTALKTGEGAVIDPKFSPDGRQVAYVRNHDLQRIELARNVEQPVTRGGTETKTHGLAEFVAQEEMSRFSGYWWSPDAKLVAYAEVDNAPVEQFTIVDPMHPEKGGDSFHYPRAGRPNAVVRLGVTPAAGGKTTWVAWDQKAYPYLATVMWPKKGPLTLLVQNREQTEQVLLAADVATGKTRVLLTEKDKAWLNLDQDFPIWKEDGSGFLWYTERNGGPEVELHAADGSLEASVVKPQAGFHGLARYVQATDTLYFNGSPNPTQSYLWRVRAGGAPERVNTGTKGPAWEVASVSKAGNLILLSTQSDTTMPQTWVLRADGTRVGQLPSVAKEPSLKVTSEVREVGQRRYQAQVIRPRDFKPGQKLPVIVYVYGGPTTTVVKHTMGDNLINQWLADQGFLVVKFDGRGTPGRDAAWERVVKYDFATTTVADQVDALRALASEVPELDLDRVGINGWSFGGYMAALATLTRGDVFKAGVAGAPVVDWRDYDTHYTERYLGTPEAHPEAYEKSSLLTYANKLERPLLLIHGTADDNVYFFHSLKLADALFKAGKPYDFLPLAGLTHMVPDPVVIQREYERMAGYFKEHLTGPHPGVSAAK